MFPPSRHFGFSRTFLLFVFAAVDAGAAVPRLIHYQGKLRDSGGGTVDATVSLRLRLYSDPTTATPILFDETHAAVNVSNGLFSIHIGSQTGGGVPDSALASSAVYLGVAIDGGTELLPRVRFVSAPYSQKADAAERLVRPGTLDTAVSVDINGRVGIGTTSPNSRLSLTGSGSTNGILLGQDQAVPVNLYHASGGNVRTDNGFYAGTWMIANGSVSAGSQLFVTNAGGPQFMVRYDAGNKMNVTAESDGAISFDAVGSGARFSFSDNVGFGNPSPSVALDVAGQVKIVDGTQGASKVLTSDANGVASWQTPATPAVGDYWVSGYINPTDTSQCFGSQRAMYVRFMLQRNTAATEISYAIGTLVGSPTIEVGIYSDNSSTNRPNARLVSATHVPATAGVQTVPIASTNLTRGTIYWIAHLNQTSSNSTSFVRPTASPGSEIWQFSVGSLPGSAGFTQTGGCTPYWLVVR